MNRRQAPSPPTPFRVPLPPPDPAVQCLILWLSEMQVEIRRAVRQTVLNVAKDLPPGATTWNSVIPSEHAVRAAAAAGQSPPAQQLEMAAAEREALQRREHAVQKAEQNIAFMEHSAAFKVRQATRQAGSTETQEVRVCFLFCSNPLSVCS